MKKLLIILLLFVSFVSFGQDISKNISFIITKDVKMYVNPTNNLSLRQFVKISRNDVIEIISLKGNYFYIKYKNNLGYISTFYFSEKEALNIKTALSTSNTYSGMLNPKLTQSVEADNSSDYLKKASNNFTLGFSLIAIDGLYSIFSTKIFPIELDNTYKDSNSSIRKSTGIVVGACAIIILISGSNKLAKAGICLDNEHKIFMAPSKSGIGVNIKF